MESKHKELLLKLSRRKKEIRLRQHMLYMDIVDFWKSRRKYRLKKSRVIELLKEHDLLGFWQLERYDMALKSFLAAGYKMVDIVEIEPSHMLNKLSIKKLRFVLQTVSKDVLMEAIRELGLKKAVRIFGDQSILKIRLNDKE